MIRQVFEPYEHACPDCKWLGWGHDGKKLTNMYLCGGKTLIIRYSSERGDYRSYELGLEKSSIGIGDGVEVEYGDKLKSALPESIEVISGKNNRGGCY
jgi:hypothetical protein